MAERLGYSDRRSLRAVERFMKHYFLVAKDVGDLTTILCSALEMEQVKASPGLSRLLNPMGWRTRRQIRVTTDFRIDNGRLNVADPGVFERDPVNLIRFFARPNRPDSFFHPNAVRLLRRSLRLIDDQPAHDKEANRIFLEMLCSTKNPEPTLRRMNEAGVLGRFIPDFGRVVSMMQFNMYHHFTVDEHLIRTIGVLSDIERGEAADPIRFPPASSIPFSIVVHSTWRPSCMTSPRAGTRITRSSARASPASLGPRLGLTRRKQKRCLADRAASHDEPGCL